MNKIFTFLIISLVTLGCVSSKTGKATEGIVIRALFSLASEN